MLFFFAAFFMMSAFVFSTRDVVCMHQLGLVCCNPEKRIAFTIVSSLLSHFSLPFRPH